MSNFIKYTFFLSCFLLVYGIGFSQKPAVPFSCYQTKSQLKSLKAAVGNDFRSDSLDIEHYNLHLDFTDWTNRILTAQAEIDIRALVSGITNVRLDLLNIQVDSVKQGSTLLLYTHNDTLLNIQLPTPTVANQLTKISVYYHGQPYQNPADWGGFYWNSTYAYNVGVSFLEDPHNYGRVWFPCFDNFVERMTFDYYVTTSNTRKAFCGGTLMNETDNGNGTTTWHWNMQDEIPSYLASVAVSDYETLEDAYNGLNGSIPIQLAVRAPDSIRLKNSFVHLHDAMNAFEAGYGPYQFERVGYCVTPFTAGAMEHACNITYMRAAVDNTTQWETLMAHELSHHWWGDLITCSQASDMWLNEGWASYSEALFTEGVYGHEAYKDYVRENHDNVLRTTHISDGDYYPVSGVPTEQTYSSTVYDKGADIAHTIRGMLGDAMFFSCIKSFLNDNAFSDVSTEDFKAHLTNCVGWDVNSFIDSWVYEPGFHHFSIDETNTTQNGSNFTAQISIRQKVRETNVFTSYMPIELTFVGTNREQETHTAWIYGLCSDVEVELPFEPVFVALDMEERISDATVDVYQNISTIGTHDFGLARLELNVQLISDSALIRVEHSYMYPDPMKNPVAGLHLSQERYWKVDGIFPSDFKTNAQFKYDGTTSGSNGYLDVDLISNSEDSLVMMYRENAQTDWTLVDSFKVFAQGSVSNKRGYIEVYNLQRGEYAFAIYDTDKVVEAITENFCEYTSINEIETLAKYVNVYPVPSDEFIQIELLKDIKVRSIKIFNLVGEQIYHQPMSRNQDNMITISSKDWHSGVYLLNIEQRKGKAITKKVVIK